MEKSRYCNQAKTILLKKKEKMYRKEICGNLQWQDHIVKKY